MIKSDQQSGFALLSTIWLAAIISLLTLSVLHGFNTNTEATQIDAMRIKHKMLHQAGLRYAALHLASPRHEVAATAIPNSELLLQLDSGQVRVKIENEAGRIDLLLAPRQRVVDLLTSLGLSIDEAGSLADGLQNSLTARPDMSYRGLRELFGSKPGLYQKAINLISLHNGQAGVHPLLASESVLDLFSELSLAEKQRVLNNRSGQQSSLFSTPIDKPIFTDRLSAHYRLTVTTVLEESRRTNVQIIKMTNQVGSLYEAVAIL